MTALNYEIRVEGVVPDDVLEEIEGVRVATQPVVTILRGTVVDQAALHGVINRLQGLGLDLFEVRRLTAAPSTGPATPASGDEQGTRRHRA
jgi:hypothetical protein